MEIMPLVVGGMTSAISSKLLVAGHVPNLTYKTMGCGLGVRFVTRMVKFVAPGGTSMKSVCDIVQGGVIS